MKIGFVLDDGLDKPDGVQQYILTLGEWYQQHGHEVRYLVGQTKRTDIPGVYSLARNMKVRFNGNRLSIPLPASSRAIKKMLTAENFDVLHVQTPYSPLFGAKVVHLADSKTAVVGTYHILPYDMWSRIGSHGLGVWLRRSLKRFDAFVSVSEPAAVFAKETFKISSTIVPNSVPIEQFKPTEPIKRSDDTLDLLFLGRLVHRKGCQQLLKALAILNQNNSLPSGVRLIICGDGPLRPALEKYVVQQKMSEMVTFKGFVTQEEKIKYMQEADIAIFPSLSGESFGIVLIEAMAAGSGVVLGGDNPGYRSVLQPVPDTIINAHKPQIFAEQLLNLINQPKKRHELHTLQQAHVKQFDTAVVANTLLNLYQSCKTRRISR